MTVDLLGGVKTELKGPHAEIQLRAYGLRTIAFPGIGTGVYGFPMARAARIAVRTIGDDLRGRDDIAEVRLVCFSGEARQVTEAALTELADD